MNKYLQPAIVVLLTAIVVLQVFQISISMRTPNLDEIDKRVMHWGLHYGSHFSDARNIKDLESNLNKQLLLMDAKLISLSPQEK